MFKSSKTRLVLLLLVLGALILYLNVPDKKAKETVVPKDKLYTIEKTGAGAVADYSATAQRIHSAVDKGLAGAKLDSRKVQEERREAPRTAVEGKIRWHARQLALPADSQPDAVKRALSGQLVNTGGEVLATEQDKYEGQAATRVDVGIRDTLGGDPLTLITDRIFIPLPQKPERPTPPKPTGHGNLAIIIDDFGYSGEMVAAFAAMPRPVTFSVLPYRPHSGEAASRALSAGHEVMLHLPMEPMAASEQSEASTIKVTMSDQEIRDITAKALKAVPGIIGVNNHQGSRATSDRRVMNAVLGVLKANNLFFVDSRTSAQSIAYDAARRAGLRSGMNEVFLDGRNEGDYIKGQLRTAARLAVREGSAIAIGHARPATAVALREMIPELEATGVKLVYASQLVR
ncbi:divergent polysaccharide deacetylase family protein [Anaeroselena agilis]|uniref:Divergent polysaccharide deacetylase family protein n=1 Tax=Anaeroselena agilis TaxID=3063788 RepID=A0ABU3NTT6_9FIRM|nr:divergent polysaccharide deacetylase family protein [Selenomonadales bacterium 4137-cl]